MFTLCACCSEPCQCYSRVCGSLVCPDMVAFTNSLKIWSHTCQTDVVVRVSNASLHGMEGRVMPQSVPEWVSLYALKVIAFFFSPAPPLLLLFHHPSLPMLLPTPCLCAPHKSPSAPHVCCCACRHVHNAQKMRRRGIENGIGDTWRGIIKKLISSPVPFLLAASARSLTASPSPSCYADSVIKTHSEACWLAHSL